MTPDTPLDKCDRAIRYDSAGRGSSDDPNFAEVR